MKYLVLECNELADQYECDADRFPVFVGDAIPKDMLGFGFEHFCINEDGSLNLIKEYDVPYESGMALYYWEDGLNPEKDLPNVIFKYPNYNRNTPIPSEVKEVLDTLENLEDSLDCCGNMTGYKNEDYYVYGEYMDDRFDFGY